MGIGLSGMISGLDTDSIVKAMVSGQQAKATKIENKITLNKWTTEAWSGLNTKIYSFYTKYASKLRLQSSYMTRTANSSNESLVKATATSGAAVGTHSLKIKKLASSQYVTGAKLSATAGTYNKNTKLTALGTGIAEGTIITITGKKDSASPEVTKLEVTKDTKVSDFLNACKKAGLTASFDESQQRFFISSSQSGKDDAFSITTSALSEDANNSFTALGGYVDTAALSATEKTAYEEAIATLRTNTDVINTVLSADYDSTNSTQKAVMNAINTVKDAAEKTYAYKTAKAEQDTAVTDAITAGAADPTATIAYGSTKLTYEKLREGAVETIEDMLVKAGEAEAGKAMKELKLGDGFLDPTTLTPEKYDEAIQLITDSESKYQDADGNVYTITTLDELKAAKEAGVTIPDAEYKALENAFAVKATWEHVVEETDEDGNVIASNTVGELYETAYTEGYDLKEQEISPDNEDDVMEIMQKRLIADQQSVYDAKVNEKKAELLALEEDPAEVATIKSSIEASLKDAAAAGVNSADDALAGMGLGQIDGSEISESTTGVGGMVVVAASNSEVVLDGATMEETSNDFTVNGITLNLISTTLNKDTQEYETVQITVGKDIDSTYNLVKEALKEYNTLIEEMNGLYTADSARGYEPLTDEQKEAMSETDIENWENKIKGALLRRDNTLGTLLSSMRSALASTYEDEDGKKYSLSSYGIVTGNYTENGKLHIYGDPDDPIYATHTDRLKKALEEDPDQVMETLTGVFQNLYDTMTDKCAKTEISSALTFYNDKQYNSLLSDYEDDLDTMQDRIAELEDRYYKQFTAMETALSKLQNQTNSLAALLGTNTSQ